MRKGYQVADARDSGRLASFLAAEGAELGGFVDLIEQSRLAVDELIAVMGRAPEFRGHHI